MEENKTSLENEEMDETSNFQKSYGWFLVVNRIASNDFSKHETIYKKGLTEVLNQLSFLIDYDKEQIRLQREAQRGF
jgi:hypothetical protein